jgi:hypothetical protein
MGLVRTALIFGAGYVLGRPEGRAKLAELVKRPEVAQLRQQAASTVSSGVKTGKEQLTKAAGRATDSTSETVSTRNGDSGTSATGRSGRRLPSFPRRGDRSATPSTNALSTDPISAGTTPTTTSPTGTSPTGTSTTGMSSTGTSSAMGTAAGPTTGGDKDEHLREQARDYIADLPAETALGNADPQGPHDESPKRWETEHGKPTQ